MKWLLITAALLIAQPVSAQACNADTDEWSAFTHFDGQINSALGVGACRPWVLAGSADWYERYERFCAYAGTTWHYKAYVYFDGSQPSAFVGYQLYYQSSEWWYSGVSPYSMRYTCVNNRLRWIKYFNFGKRSL